MHCSWHLYLVCFDKLTFSVPLYHGHSSLGVIASMIVAKAQLPFVTAAGGLSLAASVPA